MENNSSWIKFNDSSETVIKKEDISFFNKDQFIECLVSIKEQQKPKIHYQISVFLSKGELTQIRLNYKNKSSRDKDYTTISEVV
jgi:hypothetical protein